MVEDIVGNMMEAMHRMLFVKGDDCACLPKHLEASDQKYEMLECVCFGIANRRFRDAHMSELENRG